jgi:Flp pilus assembly protein TadG
MKRAFTSGETGGAMVEFALLLPVILLVVWGIIDLSRAFQTLDSLASAVREGARAGAVTSSRPDTGTTASAIKNTVGTDFTPLGAPLDTSLVTVTWDGTQVTVSATYQFVSLTPLLAAMTITRSAAFRWEQATAP